MEKLWIEFTGGPADGDVYFRPWHARFSTLLVPVFMAPIKLGVMPYSPGEPTPCRKAIYKPDVPLSFTSGGYLIMRFRGYVED